MFEFERRLAMVEQARKLYWKLETVYNKDRTERQQRIIIRACERWNRRYVEYSNYYH